MPRFAILAHDHPAPHWDLFLEAGPVLRSWRILSPIAADHPVAAEAAADHRLHYLDYEGPVSGDRGTVTRVDGGLFSWESDGPDQLLIRVRGSRFVGWLTLERTNAGWTCAFRSE